jgi:hypothetical protein
LSKDDACVILFPVKCEQDMPGGGADVEIFLTRLFQFMPLIFGVGFLAPLIAQIMDKLHLHGPFGASSLVVGLVIGLLWGGFAVWKGRWL